MLKLYTFSDTGSHGPSFPFVFGRALLDGRSFQKHAHDFSEIVIITGGKGLHSTQFGDMPIRAGDLYVIHPGVSHGFKDCSNLNLINLAYQQDYFSGSSMTHLAGFHALFVLEPLNRNKPRPSIGIHLSPGQRIIVETTCKQLEKEYKEQEEGYRIAYEGLFQTLAVQLCRFCSDTSTAITNEQDRHHLLSLGKALAMMEQHFSEDLSVAELAELSGYSINHFSRLCYKLYGLPPRQYILQQRISLAATLLSTTDLSITAVAAQCGFDDPNYFCRAFKKKMSCSPSAFRNR